MLKTETSGSLVDMDDFQATHRELLLKILRIVDDNVQCKSVCKFWKSVVEGSAIEPKLDLFYTAKLATRGQLHLLRWARKKDYPLYSDFLSWRGNVPMAAAKFGHFDIVDWYYEKGDFNDTNFNQLYCDILGYYAKWNRVEFLSDVAKYIDSTEVQLDSDIMYIINYKAARHGRTEVLDMIDRVVGESSSAMMDRCSAAVKAGNINLLKKWGQHRFLVGDETDPDRIWDLLDLCCNNDEEWYTWHRYATEANDADVLTLLQSTFRLEDMLKRRS